MTDDEIRKTKELSKKYKPTMLSVLGVALMIEEVRSSLSEERKELIRRELSKIEEKA
jgi:hypothetical protein